jgi:hypothetical protein
MIKTGFSQTKKSAKEEKLLRSWISLLIFLPFLFLAIIYVKTSFHLLFIHNDIGYPEGASVYSFLTTMRTGKLYSLPFDFPFNGQMYGPVFYLIGTLCAKAAHSDPMLTAERFRSLSFLSFFGSSVIIGWLAWKLEGRIRWAISSAVLSLACVWELNFASSARPDELSIFLILAALAVYQVSRGRSCLVFWVGVLASLSWLTKQSTVPVLIALLIDSFIGRRFRDSAALIVGNVPVPALIGFTMWFRREPFIDNFLLVRNSHFEMHGALILLISFVRTNQIAIIPFTLAVLGIGLSWRKERYRAILLAAGLSWFANVAALANIGGDKNYLLLPWLLTASLVPAGLVRLEESARRSAMIPLGVTLLGGVLLIHQRNVLFPKVVSSLDTRNVEKLKILSGLPYLEMRSREPELLDPFLYRLLSLQKVWSFNFIVEQIDREEFDLILIKGRDDPSDSKFLVENFRGDSYWGEETLGPMASHYRGLCELRGFDGSDQIALVPRHRSSVLQDKDISRIFGQPCLATNLIPQLDPGVF